MSDDTQPNANGEPRSAAPGGPLLVIDDEAAIRHSFADTLSLDGFRVLQAESAAEGRAVVDEQEGRISGILLDLLMPGEDGESFLDWVRDAYPDIPVVIASGHRDEALIVRCLQKGACDFLEKPCRSEDLRRTVNRAIRRNLPGKATTGEIEALRPAGGWVELTAPSEFEYLTRLQRFSEVLFASRLPQDTCEDMRMVIEEVGRNAIEWGNRFDPDKMFRISYCIFDDRVVIKFEDEGEGFHPDTLPDPSQDPEAHLKKRAADGKRPGGFGVFLIRNIMDEVVYSEKGNVVIMTKHIPE